MKNFFQYLRNMRRDFHTYSDVQRIQILAFLVTVCACSVQGAVDMTISLGLGQLLIGPSVGFLLGWTTYIGLALMVRNKTRLSIGIESGFLVFNVVFAASGVIGTLSH